MQSALGRGVVLLAAFAALLIALPSTLGAQEGDVGDAPPITDDQEPAGDETTEAHIDVQISGDLQVSAVSTVTQDGGTVEITTGFGLPDFADEWPYTCTWDEHLTGANNDGQGLGGGTRRVVTPTPGRFYHLRCEHDTDPALNIDNANYQYGQPTGEDVITSGDLVFEIIDTDLITLPPLFVGISPEARQVTGLETWLWPEGSLAAQNAFAEAGTLGVEVRATYQGTIFHMGDSAGSQVACTVQVETVPADVPHPCAFTYFEEGGYTITAVSSWLYEWRDNAGTQEFEELDTIELDETLIVDVVDLEALISR